MDHVDEDLEVDDRRALVVVDVRRDSGEGGVDVATRIAMLAEEGDYEVVVAMRVAGSEGAALHPALEDVGFDGVFDTGLRGPGHSGFGAIEHLTDEPFDGWLSRHGVTALDVVGVATDHCLVATALDAVRAGFAVRVLEGAVAGAPPETSAAAARKMRAAGVDVVAGLGDA